MKKQRTICFPMYESGLYSWALLHLTENLSFDVAMCYVCACGACAKNSVEEIVHGGVTLFLNRLINVVCYNVKFTNDWLAVGCVRDTDRLSRIVRSGT